MKKFKTEQNLNLVHMNQTIMNLFNSLTWLREKFEYIIEKTVWHREYSKFISQHWKIPKSSPILDRPKPDLHKRNNFKRRVHPYHSQKWNAKKNVRSLKITIDNNEPILNLENDLKNLSIK